MAYDTLKEKIRAEKTERVARYDEFSDLYHNAYQAGLIAGRAENPSPMNVINPSNGQQWHVPEGACGFAWVKIRPATSSFARYLLKQKLARTSYSGGLEIWIGEHGQSVDRKLAHAQKMADIFKANGIQAHAFSRLD